VSVRTGSRLEQLLALEARIKQEIQAERLRTAVDAPNPADRREVFEVRPVTREVEVGVIRAWALAEGVTETTRGPISWQVRAAYDAAHQEAS
jgi:hypothetical protein